MPTLTQLFAHPPVVLVKIRMATTMTMKMTIMTLKELWLTNNENWSVLLHDINVFIKHIRELIRLQYHGITNCIQYKILFIILECKCTVPLSYMCMHYVSTKDSINLPHVRFVINYRIEMKIEILRRMCVRQSLLNIK